MLDAVNRQERNGRDTDMSSGVQHQGRFALAAVLMGLPWYWLVFPLLPRPWDEFRGGSQFPVVLSFILGVFVLSWFSRRRIAALRVRWTFPVAVLAIAVGSFVIGGLLFTSVYLRGDSVEEVRMESTPAGKLIWAVLCVLHIGVQGVVGLAVNARLSIPLAWATVLCLRWASGGLPDDTLSSQGACSMALRQSCGRGLGGDPAVARER